MERSTSWRRDHNIECPWTFFYIAHGETHPEKHIGTRRMLVSHDCISLFFADTFFSLIGCFQSRPCGCTCHTTFSGSFFILPSISQLCATSATSYYLTLDKKPDYDSVFPLYLYPLLWFTLLHPSVPHHIIIAYISLQLTQLPSFFFLFYFYFELLN